MTIAIPQSIVEHRKVQQITSQIEGDIEQILTYLKVQRRTGRLVLNLNNGGVSYITFEELLFNQEK